MWMSFFKCVAAEDWKLLLNFSSDMLQLLKCYYQGVRTIIMRNMQL
jgi:hypothetical protein